MNGDLPSPDANAADNMTWLIEQVLVDEERYCALARRLTGSLEDAQEVYQQALAIIVVEKSWRRILDPPAFMMRMIFDIAVAKVQSDLPPTSAHFGNADAWPMLFSHRLVQYPERARLALARLSPTSRRLLRRWRIEKQSLPSIAAHDRVELGAVVKDAAKALVAFQDALYTLAFDPTHACRHSDDFFCIESTISGSKTVTIEED